MLKLKLLVIGPPECGKTVLANFLADATETSGGDYHPTQGVRILEFEVNSLTVGGRPAGVEVELWDCGGDKKFEACWPALARDASGIIFVYNPDNSSHEKELDARYTFFVEQQNIVDSHCVVFAHHKPGTYEEERSRPSHNFSKIKVVPTSIEDDGEGVRQEFNRFLEKLVSVLSDRQEQEELSIMNQR